MSFKLCFHLALGLGLAVAAGAGPAPRLRIGVEPNDRPISFANAAGQPDGFSAELLAAMGRSGLGDYELVIKNWTDLLVDFRAGRLDALANVGMLENRRSEMDFSISHVSVHGIIYFRRDRPPILTSADFAGKTISVLKGSFVEANLTESGGYGATIKTNINPQEGLEDVARGGSDASFLAYSSEAKYITDTLKLRREWIEDIIHRYHFAVHKGDSATLFRLNEALATVRHNGTFDRIYDKWIGPIEPHPIRLGDLRPYLTPIALGIIAIIAIFWWQRHMLARVSRQAQALRESEERFRGLVDSAFEGWLIHQDGRIVLANATYAATFGYTSAELAGKPVLELTPPSEREGVKQAIAAGRITPYETIGLRKDGSQIPIQTAGRACIYHGKPARIAAVRDLTAEKKAVHDQLVLSKLESTSILAGGIAHDFNNLLASMVLNIDMVLLNPWNAAENAQFLRDAKVSADAAKSLTQQLITFSHDDAAPRQPTDMAALLEQTVPPVLHGSNVRSAISTATDLWQPEVNSRQIERMVVNMVVNAREAMPAGGVVTLRADNIALRANVVADLPAGDYLRLTIADHGCGIPAEALPKIFDPYYSTKERGAQKGMGLGLTISQSIARRHGGAISVTSKPGMGTTFQIHLPLRRPPPSSDGPVI